MVNYWLIILEYIIFLTILQKYMSRINLLRLDQEEESCVFNYIENYVTSNKLIVYSDQYGDQNRNIKMITLWNYIVANNAFSVNKIKYKFLVSGYSILLYNQNFGLIEKKKFIKTYLYENISNN